jgi:hypothetical protein
LCGQLVTAQPPRTSVVTSDPLFGFAGTLLEIVVRTTTWLRLLPSNRPESFRAKPTASRARTFQKMDPSTLKVTRFVHCVLTVFTHFYSIRRFDNVFAQNIIFPNTKTFHAQFCWGPSVQKFHSSSRDWIPEIQVTEKCSTHWLSHRVLDQTSLSLSFVNINNSTWPKL